MNQNALQSILASEVQAILAKGVAISIDVININDIYFASVKIFETHARIEGQ